MRRLDRTRITAPDSLINPAGAGALETQSAIAFFSKKKKGAVGSFKYSAYGKEEVKKAVSDLSYDKCAYCEIKARASHDADIEHFRPKGEVTEENKVSIKPGYYWLGANWDNLFLSCQHCNQERKQPLIDGSKKNLGKKNQFPLSNNKKRIKSHKRNINDEEPYRLLIDPCKEDPMDFIEFDATGMVYAKKLPDNSFNPKGKNSIDVFALVRKFLVEARQEAALKLLSALKTFEDHAKDLNDNIDNFSQAYIAKRKKALEKEIEQLKVYSAEDKEFSAMAFFIIRDFLGKMGINYAS